METTENNKLIAEFMGQPTMIWNDPDPIEGNDYRVVYFKELCDKTALIQYGVGEINSEAEVFLSELEDIDLQYHTSWDWLMPVAKECLDKCLELENEVWVRKIVSAVCYIDELYKTVVEFIKWYNKNKED
jgi:hypothetical protein